MRRVMVVGGAGAGKSTLASQLGAITGLPVIHIDPMYWKPGWVQREVAETHAMIREAIRQESWIFDGNGTSTFTERLARADTLIFLDVSTPLRLWRVLKRTVRNHGRVRPDMQQGCPERFDFGFLLWVAGYARRSRRAVLELIREPPAGVEVQHLRGSGAATAYLASVRVGRSSCPPA